MMRRIPTATSDDELADMAERGELAPIGEPSGPVRFESAEELAQFIVNAHPVGRPNLGEDRAAGRGRSPVSYTPLTLPTTAYVGSTVAALS